MIEVLNELPPLDFSNIRGEEIGKLLSASAYVAGESGQKAVYAKRQATCRVCGYKTNIDLGVNPNALYKLITTKHVAVDPPTEAPRCVKGRFHVWDIQEVDPPTTFQEVFLRNNLESENTTSRVTNHAYRGFVLGVVPESKDVNLELMPFANTNTFDVEFLVCRVKPRVTSIDEFELTGEDVEALRTYFSKRTKLHEFLALAENVNPRIAGHEQAKLAVLLTYLSPLWIDINGQTRPGAIRTMLFGDPRQGKGAIDDYLRQKLNLGKHAIGETSSRTGITYAIDPERAIIVWGVMVEADRGLVVLEALHKFPAEDLATMREVLVKLYVEVRRSFSAKAWARTRVIADSNGRQELGLYMYPCQAVRDLPMFVDQVDVTRWDFFIPFASGEISPKDIVNANLRRQDDPEFLEYVRRLTLWAWSRQPEDVAFMPGALAKAAADYEELLSEYSTPEVPIVHEDTLYSILRVAAAFAVLSFNTPDGRTLKVEEPHVDLAYEFLTEVYDILGLHDFKIQSGGVTVTEEDLEQFNGLLDNSDLARKIVNEISFGPKNSMVLAILIGSEASSVRRTCNELKALGLIDRVGSGYRLTRKGLELYKGSETKKRAGESQPQTSSPKSSVVQVHFDCSVCHKPGGRVRIVPGMGVVYLHPECEKDFSGKL